MIEALQSTDGSVVVVAGLDLTLRPRPMMHWIPKTRFHRKTVDTYNIYFLRIDVKISSVVLITFVTSRRAAGLNEFIQVSKC